MDNQNNEIAIFEEIDPAEEKALVRKLDLAIMPLMAAVYFFQYLDKGSINYAAVFGLKEDLELSGVEFSWVVSLFYLGQLASEYPAAYILSRFHITIFVGATIVAWGAVEMSIGAAHNFHGIAAARFFLGFAEAAVSPAFVIITSNWYRRSEHPIRVATWVSMNGVSQIVGALLMYAVGGADMAIESWRAIFLVFGGLTIVCGIVFVALMPRDTTTAWFLNEREREIATRRLAIDRATRDRAHFDNKQMWEALRSPLTWLYFMMALCITLTTPILKFSSLIVNGFGFSKFRTMLVGLPGGAINFTTVWMSALIPRMFPGTRIYTAIGLTLVPLVGSIVLLALPVNANGGAAWGIVGATWLAACSSAPLCACAGLMASNVKGNTKKSIVSAGFFISYCVGCIVSPQAWQQGDAPRYTKGCILSIASWIAMLVTLVVYLITIKRKNSIRDAKATEGRLEYLTGSQLGEGSHTQIGVSIDSDLTDLGDKGFRYTT
ncbi:major facilitator superfamily domain-containing protein [Dactylonectria estremocensis]|uniref:Major facilitator superfamily domain-containing protein n=1 Tax=Dactylonectria estremocensis TaxID=1079267 RepID=A0A9P9EZS2_9HYPO|nr:major facilitator superfamily domain-containing protein [Dactylonectria estremocensis]